MSPPSQGTMLHATTAFGKKAPTGGGLNTRSFGPLSAAEFVLELTFLNRANWKFNSEK